MATYKATQPVYLSGTGQFVVAGDEFTTDLAPGSTWEPVDDGAKAAIAERDGKAKVARSRAAKADA